MTLGFDQASYLHAINNLARVGTALALSNRRLSTGQQITRAADNPAGVIAVANFDRQIAEIDATTRNGERINSMIDTADGALSQISSLLGAIHSNTVAAAGSTCTAEERAAYQAEIDSAINAIDTLVNTTTFNGARLLDGGIGFTTSGIDSAKLADVRVSSAATTSGALDLDVDLVSAAEKAVISYSNGALVDDVTFSLTGNNGTEEFTFASGTTANAIVSAVNLQADATGVDAELDGGAIYFRSADYGSSQNVSINVTDGTFVMDGPTTSDTGADATVNVNGQTTTADGLQVYFSSGDTSVRFSVTETFNTAGPGATSFSITGGGAGWQLNADPSNRLNVGISSLNSCRLGNDTIGYLRSLKSGGANALASGNYQAAANIASAASGLVSTERARLGALQSYTVDATLNSLAETKTALAGARSSIMDVDYAAESANNNRLQIMLQAGAAVLSTLNGNAQTILSLLQ